MSVCRRDTKDPIADALFRQDGLMILRTGLTRGELAPGSIARVSTDEAKGASAPVYDTSERLFADLDLGKIHFAPYARLDRKLVSKQSAKAAVSLAKVLAGAGVDEAKLSGMLDKIHASDMDVNLAGCVRYFLKLGEAEAAFSKTMHTDLGRRYAGDGQKFYLVTDTIVASGVEIKLRDESGTELAGKLDAGELAELGFELAGKVSVGSSIELRPLKKAMVIAFKAAQISYHPEGGFYFKQIDKALRTDRGAQQEPVIEFAGLDEFGNGEELFVELLPSDAD